MNQNTFDHLYKNYVLILLPILFYFFNLYCFSLNFPSQDEYRNVIKFLADHIKYVEGSYNYNNLFLTENESFPLLQRLVVLADYYLFGNVNFIRQIVVSNFIYLGIFIIFLRILRTENLSYLFLIPVAFLWFNILGYEATFRADIGVYHLSTIFLSILLFYLGIQKPKNWPFLILIAILVPLGSSNGIFSVAIMCCYFGFRRQRNAALSFLLLFCISLFVIINFNNSTGPGLISVLTKYNLNLIWSFFIFIGNAVTIVDNEFYQAILTSLVGVAIFANYIFQGLQFYKNRHLQNNFQNVLFLITTFFFISAASIVVKRYNYWEPNYNGFLHGSRYKIFSLVAIICSFLSLIPYFSAKVKPYFFFCFLVFSIFLNVIIKYMTKIETN